MKLYSMYVCKSASGLFELRQCRYIGKDHPHDVCAVARDVAEMHSMVDKYWPDQIDYGRVEMQGRTF